MNEQNRGRILAMTLGSFLAFFVFGFVDVMKGSTLSAVLEEMDYTYSRGGLIVMMAYLGFVVSSLGVGFIADWMGKKAIVVLAALFFFAGIASYSAAQSLPLFMAAFFLIGFACGSAELGANYIIIDVQRRNPGLYLNLLTAFYGLGSMLAPIYAGRMFAAGLTWRDAYLYSLAAPAVLLVYFAVARYPKMDDTQSAGLAFRELLKTAFTGTMCWVYLLNFAYVAAEVCIATWLIEYLKEVRGMPKETGTTWLALFFAGIMAGRFVGGFFVDRVGYVRSMALAVSGCIVCILVGVFGPERLFFMLPLAGLFLSIILPTATALVSTMGLKNMGAILGLFFCFVGLGGMAGPWIAGVVNDRLGLRLGMTTAAFFCGVMLLSLWRIRKAMGRATREF